MNLIKPASVNGLKTAFIPSMLFNLSEGDFDLKLSDKIKRLIDALLTEISITDMFAKISRN